MLSQINKRKISYKLNQIYNFLHKDEINLFTEETSRIINDFNRNNKKRNWFVSEKTTMVIFKTKKNGINPSMSLF